MPANTRRTRLRSVRHLLRPRIWRAVTVNSGEAVGVIAAQSIGEPGNQPHHAHLPHRRSGLADHGEQQQRRSNREGPLRLHKMKVAQRRDGNLVTVSRS